jgi:hypothetical protein
MIEIPDAVMNVRRSDVSSDLAKPSSTSATLMWALAGHFGAKAKAEDPKRLVDSAAIARHFIAMVNILKERRKRLKPYRSTCAD